MAGEDEFAPKHDTKLPDELFSFEAVAEEPVERSNAKGVLIALVVIVNVVGVVSLAAWRNWPQEERFPIHGERMNLSQLIEGEFGIALYNSFWISGDELSSLDPAEPSLIALNVTSRDTRLLVPNRIFKQLMVARISVSADQQWVLLEEHEPQREKSKMEELKKYHLFSVKKRKIRMFTPTPNERQHPRLRLVKWSPEGSALIMVDEQFNILYKPSVGEPETIALTDTGEPGAISNGVADWLYEEELLKSRKALWFSPSGDQLVFAQFNDSLVDQVPITMYGMDARYPRLNMLRYPKPGMANPVVTLKVVDLRTQQLGETKNIKPPEEIRELDHYFTAVVWASESVVSVVWLNRPQDTIFITTCPAPHYNCETVHSHHPLHSWTESYEAPIFSANGQSFLVRLPVRDGDHGHFAHVNLYDVRMRRVTPMTHGPFVVTQILAWDELNSYVYYMATREGEPGERHLYRIPFVFTPLLRQPECLSCIELDNVTNSPCLYNKAHLSPNFAYFVLECLGPGMPKILLLSTTNKKSLRVLYEYERLQKVVSQTAMPAVRNFHFEVGGRKPVSARVQLLLPPGLREDMAKTYPMVVDVQTAPGKQYLDDRLSYNFGTYLASKRDIIYARIDGSSDGSNASQYVYHNLGVKDVEEQLAVIQYLKDNLQYIDNSRMAMLGSQYGAFVTLMAMARDADNLIKCGVAMAPITRWEHYDSVYSERYMGPPHLVPGSNYKGYEAADVTKVAGNLRDKFLLLVHGTADHTVHYHHSMLLAKALTDEGILFRQMSYSDEGHLRLGVMGHLSRTVEAFLADCFRPSVEEI